MSNLIDEDQQSAIIQMLSILYCRSVFVEFRRPVLAKYPNLGTTYLSTISRPMDIGTLLLNAMQEKLTLEELRKSLHLVCDNALKFNAGYPTIEAITKHLRYTAAGLFEELLGIPFVPSNKGDESEEDIQEHIKSQRASRYKRVNQLPLNSSEVAILYSIFAEFPDDRIDDHTPTLNKVLALLKGYNSQNKTSSRNHLTLLQLLDVIIKDCQDSDSSGTTSNCEHIPLMRCLFTTAVIREDSVSFIETLDDLLGVIIVLLEERLCRGCHSSVAWATPLPHLVWATVPRDSKSKHSSVSWWPAMVLASNISSETPMECDDEGAEEKEEIARRRDVFSMSEDVTLKNISRLSANVLRDLQKIRPKVTSSNSESEMTMPPPAAPPVAGAGSSVGQFCPENYLLIEYFGDHNFAWMRADQVIPILSGNTIEQLESALHTHQQQRGNSGYKTCKQEVLKEALDTKLWLDALDASNGETWSVEKDLQQLPSIFELQKLVDISKAMSLMYNANNPTNSHATTGDHDATTTATATTNSKKRKSSASNQAYLTAIAQEEDDQHDDDGEHLLASNTAHSSHATPSSNHRHSATAVQNSTSLHSAEQLTASGQKRRRKAVDTNVMLQHLNSYDTKSILAGVPSLLTAKDFAQLDLQAIITNTLPTTSGRAVSNSNVLSTVNRLFVSKCPLPKELSGGSGTLMVNEDSNLSGQSQSSSLANTLTSEFINDQTDEETHLQLPDGIPSWSVLNRRRRAIFRTRVFLHYLQEIKPLVFPEAIQWMQTIERLHSESAPRQRSAGPGQKHLTTSAAKSKVSGNIGNGHLIDHLAGEDSPLPLIRNKDQQTSNNTNNTNSNTTSNNSNTTNSNTNSNSSAQRGNNFATNALIIAEKKKASSLKSKPSTFNGGGSGSSSVTGSYNATFDIWEESTIASNKSSDTKASLGTFASTAAVPYTVTTGQTLPTATSTANHPLSATSNSASSSSNLNNYPSHSNASGHSSKSSAGAGQMDEFNQYQNGVYLLVKSGSSNSSGVGNSSSAGGHSSAGFSSSAGSSGGSRGNKPLEVGATRFFAGEGIVYTRKVKLSASNIFFKESRSEKKRIELIKQELRLLDDLIDRLTNGKRKESNSSSNTSTSNTTANTTNNSSNNNSNNNIPVKRPSNSSVQLNKPTHHGHGQGSAGYSTGSSNHNHNHNPSLPGKVGLIAKMQGVKKPTQNSNTSDRETATSNTTPSNKPYGIQGVRDMLPI